MKSGKVLAAALALCLGFGLAGCSKGAVLDGFNRLLHRLSRYALTDGDALVGEKEEGADTYTGSYTAAYDGFSGTEYLFGGTGLEREEGNELTVTYEMTISSGSARLCWNEGTEEHLLADTSGGETLILPLSGKDNYLVMKGENLQGMLSLTVE